MYAFILAKVCPKYRQHKKLNLAQNEPEHQACRNAFREYTGKPQRTVAIAEYHIGSETVACKNCQLL